MSKKNFQNLNHPCDDVTIYTEIFANLCEKL